MLELLRTVRVIGVKRLFELQRAHRIGWIGILRGFYTARTIEALFNVGMFDELRAKGWVDPDEFAKSRNLDPFILRTLCDSLYALRVFRRNGKGYALDRKGEAIEMARGWFDISYGYEGVFHDLEALLKGDKRYGDHVYRRSVPVAAGSGEIERWLYFPLAIDTVKARGARRVLDLGCGDGTFLRDMCLAVDDVNGYGLDLAPDAIEDGKAKASAAGLDGRLHLLAEDISKIEQLPAAWRDIDLAFTFFVLHELRYLGEETVIAFLRSFRKLFPTVPLVVFEAIRPTVEEMRARPGLSVHYFLYHDLTHQKTVSREEWKRLFHQAGFQTVEERWLRFARTAIFTCR